MSSAPDAVRVACCSRSFSRHPELSRLLCERFPGARLYDGDDVLAGDALVEFLADAERVIIGLERVDAELLERLPALRVISKYGVGLDRIDESALAARGVHLSWTPGVNRRAVAELTLSLAILVLRELHLARDGVARGEWKSRTGRQLSNVTLGVLGAGNIGKDLIRLVVPFGTRILAHDLLDFPEFYAEHGVARVSLDELLERSDLVSVHLPFDDTTNLLLSRDRLGRMRRGAVLVNTARGGIVDERALLELLDSGHLAGAALDVLAVEPPRDVTLVSHPRIFCTPHLGGSTHEAILEMGRAALEGLAWVET
jgi:D-3-phosphoglycerate dehydrogenase